jgi:outer membrane lipoprotein-sorting protein
LNLRPRSPKWAIPVYARELFLAVGLAVAGGCSIPLQIAPPAPSTLKEPPIEGWTAKKLVQILSQRDKQFRSLRTLAQVNYRGPEGRQGFQEAVVIQRPDRLRLETLSGLGAILVVTANANQIAGFHPREGLFIRGKTSKENLFRYTRIPLELEEITDLLMGLPPVTGASDWQIGGNSLYREIEGKGKEIVSFDPSREIPVRWYRLGPDGKPELSASFESFSSTPAGLFPLKISLEAAGQQRVLEITYQEPELNASIPPDLFSQQKPANAKELPIEAIGS